MLPPIVSLIVFGAAALVGVEWGFAENRLFSYKPLTFDALILNHFKAYRAFMAVLFGTINALAATAIFGVFSTRGVFLWMWLMLWDTLIRRRLAGHQVLRFQVEADLRFEAVLPRNQRPMNEQADWDNWLGLPLRCSCYWWLTAFILLMLFVGLAVLRV